MSSTSLTSQVVLSEVYLALGRGARVFPVLLEHASAQEIPYGLSQLQYVDLSDTTRFPRSVDYLAAAIKRSLQDEAKSSGLVENEIQEFARSATNEARREEISTDESQSPDSVFIVHGRDLQFRDDVENYLITIGVKPVVLSKMPNAHKSLLDKFFTLSQDTKFAIVLISPDDYGALTDDFDDPNGAERALEYRARQNVILELGFFYGRLSFERVFVLYRNPKTRFPKFERPSDLNGVPWDEYDVTGKWKDVLKTRLRDHGFHVP
jgi:predicted nucleotide-binding protein